MKLHHHSNPLKWTISDAFQPGPHLSRRAFIGAGALSATALGLYAAFPARHALELVRKTIAIRNLPPAFEGFRIVQMSDFHYDEYTEPWFIREAVRRANALNPDLVALTGDFISRGPRSHRFARRKSADCAAILAELTCPLRFCILGNHDAGVHADYVISVLRDHSLPTFDDSFLPIERNGSRLWLSGARDPGVLGCNPEKAIPATPDGPVIFLCHEPDYADQLARNPRFPLVDLMLSGHSHGGQVCLPVFGPLVLPPFGQKYYDGLYRVGHMQLYVNRGIGTVGLPFRLNCPPEITELTLTRA